MLFKAFRVAAKAHRGQKDKAGKPYIFHPVHVAIHTQGKKQKIVALLHDVVEDTNITLDDLIALGFDADIIAAVYTITKKKGEQYENYLQRVKNNPIARAVKIADLEHNSDLSRLDFITDEDVTRSHKYFRAKCFLEN